MMVLDRLLITSHEQNGRWTRIMRGREGESHLPCNKEETYRADIQDQSSLPGDGVPSIAAHQVDDPERWKLIFRGDNLFGFPAHTRIRWLQENYVPIRASLL